MKSAGVLVLGHMGAFPPMVFTNKEGNVVGFDVDLASEVCSRLGLKLKTVLIPWDAKEHELKMGHVTVSLIYMAMQLVISLVLVYVIPDTALAHWIYVVAMAILLALAYLLFMKKYYHLHEEYLKSLENEYNPSIIR